MRKNLFQATKRVVVKLGSGVLTCDNGLNLNVIQSVSEQISHLMNAGKEVIIVSSGAMASGIRKIGLSKRPDDIPERQAIAAIGQTGLIMEYDHAFTRFDLKVAQILLTNDGLTNRKRYLNARNTLNMLLAWRIVPIINENDTVSTEEIQFGDNDNLSAMIALLLDADMLINLTDIEGLYTKDPRKYKDAELIEEVPRIKKNIEKYAGDIPGALGTGGMLSKIKAAKKVTAAGIPMVIAHGRAPGILEKLFAGELCGTMFLAKNQKLSSRKCWIAFALKPKGVIHIDDGAQKAILEKGKSLLPSGILGVDGEFGIGAAVEFRNTKNKVLGIGLVNYSAHDIRKISGLKTSRIAACLGSKPYDEVIHRDNLTIMDL